MDALDATRVHAAAAIADELFACYRRGGTVFIVGNGGSAATATHFACDLAKGTRGDGPPTFKVICPTDSVPLLTAWSNDTDYAGALAAFIEPLIGRGDVLIGISTSGRSENVNRAAACAAQAGATVIALTGSSGNRLERLAHLALCVPCGSIEQIEDVHSIVSHSLCVALRDRIREFSDPVPIAATMPHTNGHQPGASGVPNGWRD
ncbi:MAG TPA: SIS domain-containing protein [Thermomicrobiales bacterium]|nr:SIS domain-containing protein [Thermomicrobiales bacterium]